MNRRQIIIATSLAIVAGVIAAGTSMAALNSRAGARLHKIHQKLIKNYPDLGHIAQSELNEKPLSHYVIFDTRKPEEFAVSHLEGAIQLNPSISAADFLQRHGEHIAGRDVVFYCSVGRRSSGIAAEIVGALKETTQAPPNRIANLEGGIFAWSNAGLPLVNANGPTQNVHPFNAYWGRLLDNRSVIDYQPN